MADATVEAFLKEQKIVSEHIDFPQRRQQDAQTKTYNASIAEKYNFKGLFPTILLVENSTERVVELIYRNQNPTTFINLVKTHIKSLE